MIKNLTRITKVAMLMIKSKYQMKITIKKNNNDK